MNKAPIKFLLKYLNTKKKIRQLPSFVFKSFLSSKNSFNFIRLQCLRNKKNNRTIKRNEYEICGRVKHVGIHSNYPLFKRM